MLTWLNCKIAPHRIDPRHRLCPVRPHRAASTAPRHRLPPQRPVRQWTRHRPAPWSQEPHVRRTRPVLARYRLRAHLRHRSQSPMGHCITETEAQSTDCQANPPKANKRPYWDNLADIMRLHLSLESVLVNSHATALSEIAPASRP